MSNQTCAACDGKLEGDAIKVNVGSEAVEVCCEDCAKALKEAQAAIAASPLTIRDHLP